MPRLVARRAGSSPAPTPQNHQSGSECGDRPIRRDIDALWYWCLGREVGQKVVAPPRDQQRKRTAGGRNHQAFSDELLRQSGPARAQRAAQAHLAFAIDGAGEQKPDHVEQRDQEHDADHGHGRGGDDGQCPPFRTPCILERDERCGATRVGRRPCPGELARDRLELAVGLGVRRLRAKPRHHGELEYVRATNACWKSKRVPVGKSHPDVSVVEAGAKVAREHADDRHVESVERKREPGQRRFVQILAPEAVADDGRQLVDVVEGPTDGRLHAERVEVVVGDGQSPCDRGPFITATAQRDDGLGGDVECRTSRANASNSRTEAPSISGAPPATAISPAPRALMGGPAKKNALTALNATVIVPCRRRGS
jgi:hypothetical protein